LLRLQAITWHSDFNFVRTIGYEKVIGKIDKRDRVTISKQWTSSNVFTSSEEGEEI